MHYLSSLFLIKDFICFGQIYCPSSGDSTLYTQQQVFVMLVMFTVCQQTVNITSMTNTYCCVYKVETPDDGQQICPKHVQFFIKINLTKQCISLAFIIEYIMTHGPLNVKVNQQMHTFQINVLIQLLASYTCFEHHVFIIRNNICMYMKFSLVFFIHYM